MTTSDPRVAMENIAPPAVLLSPDDPQPATPRDIEILGRPEIRRLPEELNIVGASLAVVAAQYKSVCTCGHRYDNNCAHFLSNAFLGAGATELRPPNDCIDGSARCADLRPVRAREMWCWFQKKAVQSSRSLKANTGLWAVFQLKEAQYWGGHVCIVDTGTWKFYGTGFYPDWDQYAFKW